MIDVLAFGGGVDSTALICIHMQRDLIAKELNISRAELDEALPHFDHAVFSDPGAEFAHTYRNVETATQLGEFEGFTVHTVRKEGMTIREWVLRNGTVPVMGGGPHVCSLKFKGEVMAKWAAKEMPDEQVRWIVGIEANEGKRVTRFQANKGSDSIFPLVTLGLDRAACQDICDRYWPHQVEKSSCVFCPFMSVEELEDLVTRPDWEMAKEIEAAFEEASHRKHQAWLEAGQPLVGTKRPRAPKGMWKKDSWAEGRRLFTKTIKGKQLSCAEWEERLAPKLEKV